MFVSDHVGVVKISVFNTSSGKMIHSFSQRVNIGTTFVTITESESWPNGLYLIRAILDDQILNQKMIIAH